LIAGFVNDDGGFASDTAGDLDAGVIDSTSFNRKFAGNRSKIDVIGDGDTSFTGRT